MSEPISDSERIPVDVGKIRRLFDDSVAKAFNTGLAAGAMAERNRIGGLLKLLVPETRQLIERAINDGRTALDIFQQCFDLVAARQAPPQTLDGLEQDTANLLARMKVRKPVVLAEKGLAC